MLFIFALQSSKSKKKLSVKQSPQKARKAASDTPQKERMKKLADNLLKHRRSKTASLSDLTVARARSKQVKADKASALG